jgi:23S rRNA A1618 N6-methylase RlmF
MDAPASVASAEKPIESDMAEDICKLLEQSILKYFPQVENVDRPKASSVPLIPHRQDKPST